jgi:hypothetical protein
MFMLLNEYCGLQQFGPVCCAHNNSGAAEAFYIYVGDHDASLSGLAIATILIQRFHRRRQDGRMKA